MDRTAAQSDGPAIAAAAPAELPPGLVYVSDAMPGIARVRRGEAFAYRTSDGAWLSDAAELARIRRLAIPPAYTGVWICPLADGHLQATGRDARGRKQYRYHARWRELRDESKFDRLQAFGGALPRIRARVARDLAAAKAGAPPSREAVLATLVRLLDTTFVRVGNDAYARDNGSYGLTTLLNRHAGVRGSTLKLSFRGKSGVPQTVSVDDRRLARIVRRCQQLPGQELFQYQDDTGDVRSIGSADVNDYLHEAAGERFTAKDFRTWHGSVQALELLRGATPPSGVQMVAEVARRLGNTAAVCRKAYIHPDVLQLGLSRDETALAALWPRLGAAVRTPRGLAAAEARLLRFLGEARRCRKDIRRRLRNAGGKYPASPT
jgi:DNA topoisomerase I